MDSQPLIEGRPTAALVEATAPGKALVRVINPGWGSSGYYGADMLARDAAKAFPKGTQMFWDHPTARESEDRPERSLRDLAGVLDEDAKYMPDGPSGPGVYALTRTFAPFSDAVEQMKDAIGVSIRAMGTSEEGEAEGREGPIVTELHADPFNTVDFVTIAGRGGQVEAIFESYRPNKEVKVSDNTTTEQLVEARTLLAEKDTALAEAVTRAETAEHGRDEATTENAQLKLAIAVGEAKTVAQNALAEVDIPTVAKERIVASVIRDPKVTEDGMLDKEALEQAVKTAAEAEQKYLDAVLGDRPVRGMGSEESGDSTPDDLAESFMRLGMTEDAAKVAAGERSH